MAVAATTTSAFLAKLLAPLAPPTEPKEARRYLCELRDEAEKAWTIVLHRYHAANAYRSYCCHTRRAAEIDRRTLKTPEAVEEAKADLAMIAAVDRMMMVPAPTIGALRHKEKLRGFNGGRDRWEAAIAADAGRLTPRS